MSISAELEFRLNNIAQWLKEEAPHTTIEQKHVVQNSSEQAYWNYGYMMACADIVSRLQEEPCNSPVQTEQFKVDG
ncbi:MAG: hypothetical protein ACRBCJ_08755 [Hyphomicrobiaceae bacterium]